MRYWGWRSAVGPFFSEPCAATLACYRQSPSVCENFIFGSLAAFLLWLVGSTATFAASAPPVFVLNSLDASISVIDPVTWQESTRLSTGKEPHHLYLTPDEKSLIVANALADTLMFVDPRTAQLQRTVHGIVDPYHLRFTPDMKWLITAANRLNHVDFYRWDGKEPILASVCLPAAHQAIVGEQP